MKLALETKRITEVSIAEDALYHYLTVLLLHMPDLAQALGLAEANIAQFSQLDISLVSAPEMKPDLSTLKPLTDLSYEALPDYLYPLIGSRQTAGRIVSTLFMNGCFTSFDRKTAVLRTEFIACVQQSADFTIFTQNFSKLDLPTAPGFIGILGITPSNFNYIKIILDRYNKPVDHLIAVQNIN
jgi:hypothetical protein